MRLPLAIAVSIAVSALAAAAQADRKPAPNKFVKAAGEAFAAAMAAEDRNDLATALDLYKKSFEITPHPNTAFNMAQVHAKRNDVTRALIAYETYLALEPAAKDRAQVRAVVTELETRPAAYEIVSATSSRAIDLRTAYVIVDGAVVHKPGTGPSVTVKLAPGRHTIDIVTSLTFTSEALEVRRGGVPKRFLADARSPRIDGNVVVSSHRAEVQIERESVHWKGRRFEVPAGTHRFGVHDGPYECGPHTLVVKPGDAVAYVHVAIAEPDDTSSALVQRPKRCRPVRVTQHRLVFP